MIKSIHSNENSSRSDKNSFNSNEVKESKNQIESEPIVSPKPKKKFRWTVDKSGHPPQIFNKTLYWSIFVFGILGAARGCDEGHIVSGNIALPAFRARFGLDDDTKSADYLANLKSNITAMVQLGSIGGALIAMKSVDYFGRVRCLQIVCIIWIIGVIIQITSANLGQLISGRLIEGLAIGQTTSIGPVYLSEVAPSPIRGLAGCMFAGAVYFGILIAYSVNLGCAMSVSNNDNQWRLTLIPKLVIASLIFILTTLFCVESPRWLLKVDKVEKAVSNLSKLRHMPEDHPYIKAEISDINEQVLAEKEAVSGSSFLGNLKEIVFNKTIAYRFFFIAGAAQLLGQWSGANAVTIYAAELFALVGIKGPVGKLKMSVVLGAVKLTSAYLGAFFIIDVFGRRRALYSGVSLQLFSMLFYALFLTIVPKAALKQTVLTTSQAHASKGALAAIFLSGAGWTIGFNSVQYLLGSEIFPLHIRSFAQSLVMVLHFANQYGNSKTLPKMMLALNPYGAFYFFSAVLLLSLVFAFFLPELQGRSLESVEEVFTLPWYKLRKCNKLVPDHSNVHEINYMGSRGKLSYDSERVDEIALDERKDKELKNELQIEPIASPQPKKKFRWTIDKKDHPQQIFNTTLYLSIFVFGILGAARGYDEGNIVSGNIALPSFISKFGLNDPNKSADYLANLKSNITSMVQLGSIGGALIAMKTVDYFGRVRSLQIICIIWIIGAIIQITASNLGQLYAGRLIEGLAIGHTTSIGPVYLAEVSPSPIRGLASCIFAGAVYFGVLIGYSANLGCVIHVSDTSDNQWRFTLIPKIILAGLIFFMSILLCVESPRWLLKVNQVEKAVNNLSKLRHMPEDHSYIVAEISDINEQVLAEKEAISNSSILGNIRDIFTNKSIAYRFFCIAGAAQVLGQWSGANAVTIYASELFSLAGIKGPVGKLKMSAILGVVKVISAYLGAFFIIDVFGRKRALYSGISLQLVSILYYAIFLTIVPQASQDGTVLTPSQTRASKAALAAIFLSGTGWTIGFNSVQYLLGSEIFPLHIRSFAQSLVMVLHFSNQYGNSKALPKMMLALQPYGAFYLFVGVMVLSLVFAFLLPELQGRSLESVEEVFTLPWYKLRNCNKLVPDHSNVHEINYINSRGKLTYNNGKVDEIVLQDVIKDEKTV
ncbi:Quinate permease [Spathaspora sp. JA1]|nr:Quinate permease [Spathaspora sp. JA1]